MKLTTTWYYILCSLLWFVVRQCQPFRLSSHRLRHTHVTPNTNRQPLLTQIQFEVNPSRNAICRNRTILLPRKLFENSFLSVPLVQTTFRLTGQVPFEYAFVMNIALFTLCRRKLLNALTPSGFFHAIALGTLLWTTLGWRGWSVCVMYLVLGQTVTKVRFADKQKRGLAESREGRRGPENVWYVVTSLKTFYD